MLVTRRCNQRKTIAVLHFPSVRTVWHEVWEGGMATGQLITCLFKLVGDINDWLGGCEWESPGARMPGDEVWFYNQILTIPRTKLRGLNSFRLYSILSDWKTLADRTFSVSVSLSSGTLVIFISSPCFHPPTELSVSSYNFFFYPTLLDGLDLFELLLIALYSTGAKRERRVNKGDFI